MEKFVASNRGGMATDRDGAPVFLAKSNWELGYVADKFPDDQIRQDPRTPRRERGRLSGRFAVVGRRLRLPRQNGEKAHRAVRRHLS